MKPELIETSLAPYGLRLRGIVTLEDSEKNEYGFSGFKSVALVGNIGSSFWSIFDQSPEYVDGEDNPLDRWSTRVATEVSPKLNAAAVFPFQGPPYLPFQQWVKRAESLHQSPIGLMMHPQYGLWHAYRFALLLRESFKSDKAHQGSPCLSCTDQPCLNTCPVNAFTDSGYDVPVCAQYLNETPDADCFKHGCMARFSCPVGREYRYLDEQSQFHLQAFLNAR